MAQGQSLSERAYSGISVRENPEGLVISRVGPGPFMLADPDGALLRRNDLIVTANGQSVTKQSFDALVAGLHAGDKLALVIRRNKSADPLAALPVGDPSGEVLEVAAVLESADTYTGTIGRGSAAPVLESSQGEFEPRILQRVQQASPRSDPLDPTPGDQLTPFRSYLSRVQRNAQDSFALPAIEACFARPLSIDAVESNIARAAKRLASHPNQAAILEFVRSCMGEVDPSLAGPPAPTAAHAMQIARHLRDSVTIEGPDSKELIATINAAPSGVSGYVLTDKEWRSAADWEDRLRRAAATTPSTDIPPEVRDAVTGEILYFERLDDGRYAIAGADGANSYDMDRVEIVYDVGGNDTYIFGATHSDSPANHIIIDLWGNDTYISESDFHGPGVAVNGFSLIDDRGGNDTYRSSSQFSIAAGLFGVGVILDRSGDDTYENRGKESGWAIGAGIYGAGLVIDLSGDDTYISERLSQGAAGPHAIGAIIDAQGNDTYTANGPSFPSAYNTPGTFLSMSQGFSTGIRGFASGGIGALFDFAGDDHYTAGEFSQGCGYYFSLGILHDSGGDDIYNGNRYCQAAAAHQAVGILIDESGNDRYSAKTAACQSGAWDQSITLFVDRSGDDTYTADDLCQGAAAQQALALFFDLAGNDRYQAAGGADSSPGVGAAVQGHSGSNEYHYDADRMFSLSLFSDAGGTENFFSTGRSGIIRTGAIDAAQPARSRARGIFADH